MSKFNRQHFKCTFNPEQSMFMSTMYGEMQPITLATNLKRVNIPKNREDYSEEFLKWFVDWHAKLLNMNRWVNFPDWLIQMVKKRAEELHEGLKFNC